VRALRERVEHGVYGYGTEPRELRDVVVERLARLYNWQVEPEAVLFLPCVKEAAFLEPLDIYGIACLLLQKVDMEK
jgi:bifunctional pyridoxal-dependent enzyme with beta-cystathionase and maltose regulon repressor activities